VHCNNPLNQPAAEQAVPALPVRHIGVTGPAHNLSCRCENRPHQWAEHRNPYPAPTTVMADAMSMSKGHLGGPWPFRSGYSGMPYARPQVRRATGAPIIDRSTTLATPNYSYEKRQRELAKKRKAEEKKQKKARPSDGSGDDAPEETTDESVPTSGDTPPPAA